MIDVGRRLRMTSWTWKKWRCSQTKHCSCLCSKHSPAEERTYWRHITLKLISAYYRDFRLFLVMHLVELMLPTISDSTTTYSSLDLQVLTRTDVQNTAPHWHRGSLMVRSCINLISESSQHKFWKIFDLGRYFPWLICYPWQLWDVSLLLRYHDRTPLVPLVRLGVFMLVQLSFPRALDRCTQPY